MPRDDFSTPALLCTTAEGWLQRVVVLGTETHVIEEIQLFETAQPVDSLTISHSKVSGNREGCPVSLATGDVISVIWHRTGRDPKWGCEGWKCGRCVALWGPVLSVLAEVWSRAAEPKGHANV